MYKADFILNHMFCIGVESLIHGMILDVVCSTLTVSSSSSSSSDSVSVSDSSASDSVSVSCGTFQGFIASCHHDNGIDKEVVLLMRSQLS